MTGRRISTYAFAGVFFMLSVAALGLGKSEMYYAFDGRSWRGEIVDDSSMAPPKAFSIRAEYAFIDKCLQFTTAVAARLLPQIERQKRAAWCQRLTSTLLATSPENAYGWFASAQIAAITGQSDVMNTALEASYAAGPNEQWIAEQRVNLAENMRFRLSDAALRGHRHDLATLTQSQRGIQAIVQRYLQDPDFRGRIASVVETLPMPAQQRFVDILRQEVGGG